MLGHTSLPLAPGSDWRLGWTAPAELSQGLCSKTQERRCIEVGGQTCKARTEFIPTPMVWETKKQPGLYQVSGRTEEQKPWEKTRVGKAAASKKKIMFP